MSKTSMATKKTKKIGRVGPRTGPEVLRGVLNHAAPRPTPSSSQDQKTKYAVRFADKMAEEIAKDLAPKLPGIDASTKRSAPSSTGKRQLDINFSTPKLGLALGISLKSVHIREMTTKTVAGKRSKIPGRYTHNLKRNDEEFATEASVYHERQPYAVMLGLLFLPFDSCTDAVRGSSSFGSWVKKLRMRTGRIDPDGRVSIFEKIYVALYEPDGSDMKFFDVQAAPPKNAVPRTGDDPLGEFPRRLLSYGEFIDAAYQAYQLRNHTEFRWDDGEVEMLSPVGDEED